MTKSHLAVIPITRRLKTEKPKETVISALVLASWARKIRHPAPEGPARQTISVQKTDVPPQSDEPGIGKILELMVPCQVIVANDEPIHEFSVVRDRLLQKAIDIEQLIERVGLHVIQRLLSGGQR